MAGNWLGVDAPNIATGWGPAPQLQGRDLSGMVAAILRERLEREKLTRESISDTIKHIQQQRASGAYLDAARSAEVLPEGAMEGVDSPYAGVLGGKLADQIREKKAEEARAKYTQALGDAVGGGGDGGGGMDEEENPPFKVINGINHYRVVTRGPHGGLIVNYRPYAAPIQDTTARQPSVKDTYQLEAEKLREIENLQPWRKLQEKEDIEAKRPGVPFKRQADEDQLQRDIEDLRRLRTQPQADTGAGRHGRLRCKGQAGGQGDPEGRPQGDDHGGEPRRHN